MPRKPANHKENAIVQLHVRMPGWLKNKIAAHCEEKGMTMNAWAAAVLDRSVDLDRGFPEPPPAQYPLPTLEEQLRIRLRGDDPMEPCGRRAPCERNESGVREYSGMHFCNHCNIRVQ